MLTILIKKNAFKEEWRSKEWKGYYVEVPMSSVAYYMNNDAIKNWKRDVCWSKLIKSWSDVEQLLCLLDGRQQSELIDELLVQYEMIFAGWGVSKEDVEKMLECYRKKFVCVSVAQGEGVTEGSVSTTQEYVSLRGMEGTERRRCLKGLIGKLFERRGMDKMVVVRKKEWGEVYGDVLECCGMRAGRGGRNAKDVLTKKEFVAAVQEWCDEVGRADWRPAGVSSMETMNN